MADFTDEHKVEQGNFIGEGIHKVSIVDVTGGVNDNEKEFIEFTVEDADGGEGNARMWFTTDKAIKFTFNTVRAIFVHNALEGKDEAAREMVNKVKNSEELVALCKKVLIGKEAFYQVEKSDYTYTNQAGESKQGYNRNLFGYEPKPKPKTAVEQILEKGGEVLDLNEVPDVF
jgi:hypothetical protein